MEELTQIYPNLGAVHGGYPFNIGLFIMSSSDDNQERSVDLHQDKVNGQLSEKSHVLPCMKQTQLVLHPGDHAPSLKTFNMVSSSENCKIHIT